MIDTTNDDTTAGGTTTDVGESEIFYSTYAQVLISLLTNLAELIKIYGSEAQIPQGELETVFKKNWGGGKTLNIPDLSNLRESILSTSELLRQILPAVASFMRTTKGLTIGEDNVDLAIQKNIELLNSQIDRTSKGDDENAQSIEQLEEFHHLLEEHFSELEGIISQTSSVNDKFNELIKECLIKWEENEKTHTDSLLAKLSEELSVVLSKLPEGQEFAIKKSTKSHLAMRSELESDPNFAEIKESKKEKMTNFELRAYTMLAAYKSRTGGEENIFQNTKKIIEKENGQRLDDEKKIINQWKDFYKNFEKELNIYAKQLKSLLGIVTEEEKKIVPSKAAMPTPAIHPQTFIEPR